MQKRRKRTKGDVSEKWSMEVGSKNDLDGITALG
jgi:hypothetical protein